jgi:hypothetical protein
MIHSGIRSSIHSNRVSVTGTNLELTNIQRQQLCEALISAFPTRGEEGLVGPAFPSSPWHGAPVALQRCATTKRPARQSACYRISSVETMSMISAGKINAASYGVLTWGLACDSRVVDLGVPFEHFPNARPNHGLYSRSPPASPDWLKG